MLFRGRLCVVTAVILAAVLSGAAWAEFRPRVSTDKTTVLINGRTAIRFLTANGNMSPASRADLTASRLSGLIGAGLKPQAIFVKGQGKTGRVYAGETFICVATKNDAKKNHTGAIALANSWASHLRSLIAMPAIKLSDKSLLVPLGENRSIVVSGAAIGPISAEAAKDAIATVTANNNSRVVQVSGQKLGASLIDISVDGEHATLSVSVKKYAGSIANAALAQVTGNPCPTSAIAYAAVQAVKRSLITEPGASAIIGEVDFNGGALGNKQSRRVDVNVTFSGEEYITSNIKAPVQIENIPMAQEDVKQLFYSNAPERLLKYQVLFAGMLEVDKGTRLLFHHQNDMGKRANFTVDLINPGTTSATFRIFRGVSSPSVDTVLVGYVATSAFIKDYTNEVSILETVPPQSRLVLVSHKLEHDQTTSGVLEINQVSGDTAYLRVQSLPPGVDYVERGDITPSPNPIALSISEHVYPTPVKTINAEYVIGRQWAFIPIGKHAITDANVKNKLYGNYGVTYNINVKIQNPTAETKKVIVAFDATAGLASGVFMIDGAFVATKYAKPPISFNLASYRLKPGEVRNINIVTLPVAGSNYPAMVIVKS